MTNNHLLKLTLLAGIDMTALSGTIASAADEAAAAAASVSTATATKPISTGKPSLTEKDVWGRDYSHAWHRAKKPAGHTNLSSRQRSALFLPDQTT